MAAKAESRPITRTAAKRYVREARGIALELWPETLRFHPAGWHGSSGKRWPPVLGFVVGANGPALHRTFLRPDGAGKAAVEPQRAPLGPTRGGAVRLTGGPGPLRVRKGLESVLCASILRGDPMARTRPSGIPLWLLVGDGPKGPAGLLDLGLDLAAGAAARNGLIELLIRWKAPARA